MFPWDTPPCEELGSSGFRKFDVASFQPLLLPSLQVFACALLARLVVFATLLRPLSRFAVGTGAKKAKEQRKFREAAWRATLYAVACGYAVKTMMLPEPEAWVLDSKLFWEGWPSHEVTTDMHAIYALYIGLYCH